tara:strand:+ start:65 stop:667 length:603 start_codon:yes stop_codon:yes gene_type:complete
MTRKNLHQINCVVIQASGSMAAQGRREAMFTAAQSFAPCDVYANDEGRILYCGYLDMDRTYTNAVMMPMTGREDSAPLFALMGFMQDYQKVIFIDDGDGGIHNALSIKNMFEVLEDNGIKGFGGLWSNPDRYKGNSNLHTVIVRDFGAETVGVKTAQRIAGKAEKEGIAVAFFNSYGSQYPSSHSYGEVIPYGYFDPADY